MAGGEERLVLMFLQDRAFEEGHHLLQHGDVSGGLDVVGDDEAEPDAVVRDAGADAAAGFGQPPVLHVAFAELPRGGAQDLRARQLAACSSTESAMTSCSWSRKP